MADSKMRRDKDKMQAQAARMKDRRKAPLAAAMLTMLVGAGWASAVHAEALPDFRKHAVRPGKTQAEKIQSESAARCARYGEGFVPVVGSDSCVKIGGRLRIDLGASARAPAYAGPHDGINPAAHVRVGR